jgi:hypothetical protein
MADRPIRRPARLAEAGYGLRHSAVAGLVTGTVVAAAELLLFGWELGHTVTGALVGTGVWGTVYYLRDMANLVPRGDVQEAPRDVAVERTGAPLATHFWLVGLATLCLPLAWLVDRFDVGAAFMPGVPFGSAVASLIALASISRWERTHGRRLLYEPDGEDVRPYVGDPL